jgi:regulator of sigma E protease
MEFLIQVAIYTVSVVILLGLCIFIHELGHLLGGKMVGIKARDFSMGYGKGILKKKIGDTTYQITAIPFGGYCAFYGDDPSAEREGKDYEFLTASPLRRIVVVIMGPLFNLFLGIFIFFVMNFAGYETVTNRVMVSEPQKKGANISPAFKAGLKDGDRIVEINGEKIRSWGDVSSEIIMSDGKMLNIKIKRAGKEKSISVKPVKRSGDSFHGIGVEPYSERVVFGELVDDEPAKAAGFKVKDEIIAVDGQKVKSSYKLIDYVQARPNKKIIFTIKRGEQTKEIAAIPKRKEEITIKKFKDHNYKDGVAEISTRNLVAIKKACNDKKVKVQGQLVKSFANFKQKLAVYAGKKIKIESPGGVYSGIVKYRSLGLLGFKPGWLREKTPIEAPLGESLKRAFVEPYKFIVINLKGMGMLFTGKLDVQENLSGPIRIGKLAGDTLKHNGVSAFILLIAKISIILMIMNLLPIPAVDGSYILFFTYEAIRGRPINEKVMEKIQIFGFAVLMFLMVFVVFNDIARFFR